MHKSVTSTSIFFKYLKTVRYAPFKSKVLKNEYKLGSNIPTYISINNEDSYQINHASIENNHAHNMLLSLPEYSKTTIDIRKILGLNWYSAKDTEVKSEDFNRKVSVPQKNLIDIQCFEDLIPLLQNSEDTDANANIIIAQKITGFLSKNVQNLSDDDLLSLMLNCIPIADKYEDFYMNYHYALDILSKACVLRSQHWNANQLLLVADIWYAISKTSNKFHSHVVQELHAKRENLEPYQFVQSFFYINLIRKFSFSLKHKGMKNVMLKSLQRIGVEELGIIAMGLFKTRNVINDVDILQAFVELLVNHKESVSDISLGAILKLLRNSLTLSLDSHIKLCSIVMCELKSEVNTKGHFVLIQLASLGNVLSLYDTQLLTEIVMKLSTKFPSMRMKDMERLCFVLVNSTFESLSLPKLIELFETELLSPIRKPEIQRHATSFLSLIFYLACMGHYNSFLISEALELNDPSVDIPVSVDDSKKGSMKEERLRQLYILDMMLHIEGPNDYDGYKLSSVYAQSLRKKYLPRVPSAHLHNLTGQELMYNQLIKILKIIFQDNYLKVIFILPSSPTPEVIFCTDQDLNLIPVPQEELNKFAPEDVKIIHNSQRHIKWNAIVFAYEKKLCLNGSEKLKGIAQTRVRLLEKLGYNVVIIHGKHIESLTPEKSARRILRCITNYISEDNFMELKEQLLPLTLIK